MLGNDEVIRIIPAKNSSIGRAPTLYEAIHVALACADRDGARLEIKYTSAEEMKRRAKRKEERERRRKGE